LTAANCIQIEKAMESSEAKDELSCDIRKSFLKHDTNNNGYLDKNEFRGFLAEEGHELSRRSLNEAYRMFDIDHVDDKVDMHELYTTMKYLKNIGGSDSFLSQLTKAVKQFQQECHSLWTDTYSKLKPYHNLLNIKDDDRECQVSLRSINESIDDEEKSTETLDPEFKSVFSPVQMRCIALVSHNNMKASMKRFVIGNKNILKNFRLTGTKSTMAMLKSVFKDDPDIVYGASCESGPLGGDAQLVAQICSGSLGGIVFFQDPMESHAHNADIECLNRQTLIHNIMVTHNPTSALMMMTVLRTALKEGKAELIPSFFFSLEGPSVYDYKQQQKSVIKKHTDS